MHIRIFAPLNLFKGVVKRVKFKNNITLDLHVEDWIQQSLYFLGTYEEAELEFVKNSLGKGDVFIDIGTNIGLHSLYASSLVGESGEVISFEPFNKTFETLKNNVSLNNSANIRLEKIAIAESEKEIEIFYDSDNANLGMASSYAGKKSYSEKIAAISLDLYLLQNPVHQIDFIKLDIEGAEYYALQGMNTTLKKFNPKLLIEIEEEIIARTDYTAGDMIQYLSDLGYQQYFIDEKGNLSDRNVNYNRKNYAFLKAII